MRGNHDSKSLGSFGVMNQQALGGNRLGHGRIKRQAGRWIAGLLLLALAVFAAPSLSRAASISVGISVGIAPPPLPVYAQPPCPAPGYIWTPGYWAYDPANGYFWVPGTWVLAPAPGLLWTPGYWGWGGAAFVWHVGFYGGVNYGFGYFGVGYVGGEWRGGTFFYNRGMNNFGGVHITNVYYHPLDNITVNHVSYNGGAGGLSARPTPGELAAEHDRHVEATSMQQRHEAAAHNDRAQFASVNHGRPAVAATGRPGEFRGAGVVQASRVGGAVNPAGGVHGANTAVHGSNTTRTTGYAGTRTPNPGGGGTHPLVTAHSNAPAAHNSGPPAHNSATRPGEKPEFHSAPPAHNESARGAAPNHPAASRPQGKQESAPPRPSKDERSEPHERER